MLYVTTISFDDISNVYKYTTGMVSIYVLHDHVQFPLYASPVHVRFSWYRHVVFQLISRMFNWVKV
jgi:hypothetical protein